MRLFRYPLLLSAVLLSACNASGVKSDPQGLPPVVAATEAAPPAAQTATNAQQTDDSGATLELVSGRITTIQDHLLQLKTQSLQLQQQNQILLLQLQELKKEMTDFSSTAQTSAAAAEQPDPDAFNGVLDQITMMANELSTQVQDGAFRMSSAYTAKGQWVLIRYHRYSGETWLADQGQWHRLEESGSTGTAEYEVVMLRADHDAKGYVAARINRLTGDSWWLKQNIWQPYVNDGQVQ